eukprot:1602824-Rhodomonas_salina.1
MGRGGVQNEGAKDSGEKEACVGHCLERRLVVPRYRERSTGRQHDTTTSVVLLGRQYGAALHRATSAVVLLGVDSTWLPSGIAWTKLGAA